mmetsp:Transcript_51989/g.166483  ORF Transcript_51989/g.166483 Transcript_51989/m.166483 type:complete len:284 (+) Transcript_51989:604-1455(+)
MHEGRTRKAAKEAEQPAAVRRLLGCFLRHESLVRCCRRRRLVEGLEQEPRSKPARARMPVQRLAGGVLGRRRLAAGPCTAVEQERAHALSHESPEPCRQARKCRRHATASPSGSRWPQHLRQGLEEVTDALGPLNSGRVGAVKQEDVCQEEYAGLHDGLGSCCRLTARGQRRCDRAVAGEHGSEEGPVRRGSRGVGRRVQGHAPHRESPHCAPAGASQQGLRGVSTHEGWAEPIFEEAAAEDARKDSIWGLRLVAAWKHVQLAEHFLNDAEAPQRQCGEGCAS